MIALVCVLIGLLIVFQLYFVLKGFSKIRSFKKAIPPADGLTAVQVYLSKGSALTAEQILAKKDLHTMRPEQRISEERFFEHLVKASQED
jgi:hypothetical protein